MGIILKSTVSLYHFLFYFLNIRIVVYQVLGHALVSNGLAFILGQEFGEELLLPDIFLNQVVVGVFVDGY